MKVRWTTGSIRFRIMPQELQDLLAGMAVSVSLPVPGTTWTATIRPGEGETVLQGEGQGNILLLLSPTDLGRLAEPTEEGVYFRMAPEGIRYFIEKDFPCVHPRSPDAAEVESETFAPPPGFTDRHQRGTLACS